MNIPNGVLQLESITHVARDTKKFLWTITHLKSGEEALSVSDFTFKAGQFISLGFGPKTWRAYSIASLPQDTHLELIVRIIPGGAGSTALDGMTVGDTLPFRGPFGHFGLSQSSEVPLIFCATGTGIAPMKGMIRAEAQKEAPRLMQLWYGGRNPDDIAYLDELADWSKKLQIRLAFSRTDDFGTYAAEAEKGRITQFIEKKEFPENAEFYICGNGDMVKSVKALLKDSGVDKKQIFMERFN
jgi:CDP-4-dehydro-6-deoxyglucose reductase